jgi:hypothetical protein
MKKLIRNPVVVLVTFCAVFLLLLRSGPPAAILAIRAVVWAALLIMSGIAIFKMVRHRRLHPYRLGATLPRQFRRWVFDEPDDENHRRTR